MSVVVEIAQFYLSAVWCFALFYLGRLTKDREDAMQPLIIAVILGAMWPWIVFNTFRPSRKPNPEERS